MNPDATIQHHLEPAVEAWWAAEPGLPMANVDLLHEESYLLSHEGEQVIEPLVFETPENNIENTHIYETTDETLRPVLASRRAKTIVAALAGIGALLGPQVDEAKDIWTPNESVMASVEESAYQMPTSIEAHQENWAAAKFVTAVESMPLPPEELTQGTATFETKQAAIFTDTVELQPQLIEPEVAPIEAVELASVSLPYELLSSDPGMESVIAAEQVIEHEPAMFDEVVVDPPVVEQEYTADTDESVAANEDDEPTYPTILEPIEGEPESHHPILDEQIATEKAGGVGAAILAVGLLAVYTGSFLKRAIATGPRKAAVLSKPAVQPAPILKPVPIEATFVAPTITVEEVVPKPRHEIVSHRKHHQQPRHSQKSERREFTKAGVVRRSTGWLPQWLRGPIVAPSVPVPPAVQQSVQSMPVVMSQGMPLAVAPPPPLPPPFIMPTPNE